MGVELVLHLARRVVEQLDRVRREAAERLEEQRVDDVLLSLREVVVAPLRLEAAVAGLRVVLVVCRSVHRKDYIVAPVVYVPL